MTVGFRNAGASRCQASVQAVPPPAGHAVARIHRQAGRNPKILLERELFEPSNMCYWNGGSSRARGAARVSARSGRTSVLSWSGGQS